MALFFVVANHPYNLRSVLAQVEFEKAFAMRTSKLRAHVEFEKVFAMCTSQNRMQVDCEKVLQCALHNYVCKKNPKR